MKLAPIVAALRDRCPVFERRVFGVGELSAIDDAPPQFPAAFVLPLDEEIRDITVSHIIRANIYERVAIVVVQDLADHQGMENYDALHDIRTEIWRAIVGWQSGPLATPFAPDGGEPIGMDRARYQYQFDFARMIVMDATTDGYQEPLDDFEGANIGVDAIDIADPNVVTPGPDGRDEIGANVDVEPP